MENSSIDEKHAQAFVTQCTPPSVMYPLIVHSQKFRARNELSGCGTNNCQCYVQLLFSTGVVPLTKSPDLSSKLIVPPYAGVCHAIYYPCTVRIANSNKSTAKNKLSQLRYIPLNRVGLHCFGANATLEVMA